MLVGMFTLRFFAQASASVGSISVRRMIQDTLAVSAGKTAATKANTNLRLFHS